MKPVDNARQAAKPATERRFTGDSVPPATIHLGIAEGDQTRRVADGMRPGRAGGDDGMIGALEAEFDGDVAGGKVDQAPPE